MQILAGLFALIALIFLGIGVVMFFSIVLFAPGLCFIFFGLLFAKVAALCQE